MTAQDVRNEEATALQAWFAAIASARDGNFMLDRRTMITDAAGGGGLVLDALPRHVLLAHRDIIAAHRDLAARCTGKEEKDCTEGDEDVDVGSGPNRPPRPLPQVDGGNTLPVRSAATCRRATAPMLR
jgi:hypothetical protein